MDRCICCKEERIISMNKWCQECLDKLDNHIEKQGDGE